MFVARASVALAALAGGAIAILLLDRTSWRDVLAGALLAWAVSAAVWAVGSFRHDRETLARELRRVAEIDLVHARLNQIACALSVPRIGLSWQLEHVLLAREERLAHFSGLDEFREEVPPDGHAFWDEIAISDPDLSLG